jgi:hypothetical protein
LRGFSGEDVRGYRNVGRKPYETFTKGKKEVAKIKSKGKDNTEVRKAARKRTWRWVVERSEC